MDSNAWWLVFPFLAVLVFWGTKWEENNNIRRQKERDQSRARTRETLDYFLAARAKFRDRMRRYRGVPDVPRTVNAYVVLYFDGEVWKRLADLGESDPMAIRLRLTFLDFIEKQRDHLGWIGFTSTEDDLAASNEATEEFQKAKDLLLSFLGAECRSITMKAEHASYNYFNEDGTFRGENNLNLPPVIAP